MAVVLALFLPAARNWWIERKLIEDLSSEDRDVQHKAAEALAKRGSLAALPKLLELSEPHMMNLRTDVHAFAQEAVDALLSKDLPSGAGGLLRALRHPSDLIRKRAAYYLLGTAQAHHGSVQALESALGDPEPSVRALACGALWALGADSQSLVPILADCLAAVDTSSYGDYWADLLLESMGPEAEEAVPALVSRFRTLALSGRRSDTLIHLGPAGAVGLATLLKDPDPRIREVAAVVIASVYPLPGAAVPALCEGLQDADPEVRLRILSSLAHAGPEAAPAVGSLRTQLTAEEPSCAAAAADAMGCIGAAALPALPELLRGLRAGQPALRAAAAKALGRICPGIGEVLGPLRTALEDPDSGVRAGAARALLILAPESVPALESLGERFTDENLGVRIWAGAAAYKLDPSLQKLLPQIAASTKLHLQDDGLPVAAIEAIGELEELARPVAAMLIERALDASDRQSWDIETRLIWEPRLWAEILAKVGLQEADLQPLLDALSGDEKPANRAASLLGRLGPLAGPAVPALVRALESPSSARRIAAIEALQSLGGAALPAIPELEKRLQDEKYEVRRSVAMALRHLRGAAFAIEAPRGAGPP